MSEKNPEQTNKGKFEPRKDSREGSSPTYLGWKDCGIDPSTQARRPAHRWLGRSKTDGLLRLEACGVDQDDRGEQLRRRRQTPTPTESTAKVGGVFTFSRRHAI